jgi:hypothetical protein
LRAARAVDPRGAWSPGPRHVGSLREQAREAGWAGAQHLASAISMREARRWAQAFRLQPFDGRVCPVRGANRMPFLDFAGKEEAADVGDEVTLSTTLFASLKDPSGRIQTTCQHCDIMTSRF